MATDASSKMRRPSVRAGLRGLVSVLLLLVVVGCQKVETRFDIYSTSDPNNPELFTEFFEPGAFSVTNLSNWRIVFELPEVLIQVQDTATPGDEGEDDSAEPQYHNVPMAQYVMIDMFWRPLPGTTHAESSQINASIVYCLVTGTDVISYEGAGFVFFKRSRDGKEITGRIESATLVPVRRVGTPHDLFGPCRLQATFEAKEDSACVVGVKRRLERLLGRPSPASSIPIIKP